MKITVVGLGPGDENSLSLGSYRLLSNGDPVFLRTEKHPVIPWLRQEGVRFQTFDPIYEKHRDFAAVYREIADRLMAEAEAEKEVIYGVPGHPSVAEKTVQILLQEGKKRGIRVDIQGGESFLDPVFAKLNIDPIDGFLLLDGSSFKEDLLDPRCHLLIAQVYDRWVASEVKLSLMEVFPDDYPVTVISGAGVPDMEKVTTLPLHELDREEHFHNLSSVYVPPTQDEKILRRRFDNLVHIIRYLRGPDGCPWDRKQTHQSLRPYLLEESYEFLDAVAENDPIAMADELGDVLLQVLLHAEIGREEGEFDMADVIQNLADKMIRRHPHVFGDEEGLQSASEVKQRWDAIKQQEKRGTPSTALEGIPGELPGLLKACQLQRKASKVGFDWDHPEPVRKKVEEELEELFQAEPEFREEELGDLLFAVVNMARLMKIDPEQALLAACRKFKRRFQYVEQEARRAGGGMEAYSLDQLDQWWEEAKKREKYREQ